jgi:hypothetical protein
MARSTGIWRNIAAPYSTPRSSFVVASVMSGVPPRLCR